MSALGRAMMSACAPSTSGRGAAAEGVRQPRLPLRAVLPRPGQLFRQQLEGRTAAGLPRQRRLGLQVSALQPKRTMSLKQRVRVAKNVFTDQLRALGGVLSALPPIAALLQLAALLNRKLQPLYDLVLLVQTKYEELIDSYNDFVAEETKRRWGWENKFASEIEFWKSVPYYLFLFFCTLLYQACVPVSVIVALVMPLYYSWIAWDHWLLSPVGLGTLVMAPFKFVPWADMCWVWPGLI